MGRLPGRPARGEGRPAVPPAQELTGTAVVGDAVIEWFDSHCHLQEEFAGTDSEADLGHPHATRLAATIARAAEAGVSRMVCVGTGADSSAEAVSLARAMRQPGS